MTLAAYNEVAPPELNGTNSGWCSVDHDEEAHDENLRVITHDQWIQQGFSAESFGKLDSNGDGVLDQVELNVLDVTTWTTGHAHTRSKELELIQPAPLLEFKRMEQGSSSSDIPTQQRTRIGRPTAHGSCLRLACLRRMRGFWIVRFA